MQRLTRSFVMTGALAFAGVLAGCGDDVSIQPDPTISVTPGSASLKVGESATLTATVGGVSNKAVTWTSSDQAKATVDANGKVTAVAIGNATITATAAADADLKASALITITGRGVNAVAISPNNAILKVGEFIQATANVDADPGVARTVTWSSSANTVATVDATGKVTAVANGTATITATSTVDNSVSGTLALTVRALQSAQISVQKITTGTTNTPVNFNNVAGQIDVTLNLDPGDQTVTKVEVLLDGAVACSQDLSVAESQQLSLAGAFENVEAVDIVCSINTAELKADNTPKYMNGVRQLTARATIGGTQPGNVATPSTALTFNNANTYIANTAFGGTTAQATSAAGFAYRRGSMTVTIVPVVYSGSLSIAQGSLTFGNAGCDASGIGPRTVALVAGANNTWTATYAQSGVAAGAGNVVNYEYNAGVGCPTATGETFSLNATDNNGNTIFAAAAPANTFGVRLDNRPPGAPTFVANPNVRQNGWINAAVGLTGLNTSATDNDWMVNGTADAGVGGYNRLLRVGDAAAGTVAAANAATASATPALPAPTVANNSLCAVATATDLLGNESPLPANATVCLAPPLASFQATGSQHLRFGVDVAAPTIAFSGGLAADARINAATVGAEFQVTVTDTGAVGNSGMLSGASVIGTVQVRNATGTTCLIGAGATCTAVSVNAAPAFPLVPTTTVAAANNLGYYTYTALSQDAAGNQSGTVTRVIVRDNTPATATSPAVPVSITGAFTASAFLNDDLSIRDYYYTVGFGGSAAGTTIRLASAPTAVDAFNAATLTTTNFAINSQINTFLGLQQTAAGNVPQAYVANDAPLAALNLFVRDQAQAAYTAATPAAVAPTAPATGVNVTNFTTFVPGTSNATICAGTLPAGCGATPTSTTLTATANGTTAVFNNPFSRVDFYGFDGTDFVLLGSVPAASASLVDDGAVRTWTYSFSLSGAAAGSALGTGVVRNIVAFGVNAAGNVALVSLPVAQTINP